MNKILIFLCLALWAATLATAGPGRRGPGAGGPPPMMNDTDGGMMPPMMNDTDGGMMNGTDGGDMPPEDVEDRRFCCAHLW